MSRRGEEGKPLGDRPFQLNLRHPDGSQSRGYSARAGGILGEKAMATIQPDIVTILAFFIPVFPYNILKNLILCVLRISKRVCVCVGFVTLTCKTAQFTSNKKPC